jgi:excisionase family DNA binding protein
MYVTTRTAVKRLGVHANTLRNWANAGKIKHIRISGGQRRYDVDSYSGERKECKTICYCRVSSHKQKDDLERQVQFMRANYPTAEVVRDIGSGINFKRQGLRSILERLMRGDKLTVVVAYRDRLARFGFDLFKFIIEFNGGTLMVLNEITCSPESELTNDLLTILHVFSCRMHGLRKYKTQIKEDQDLPHY